MVLSTTIAEHDNIVSMTLRFWKSNHYIRSYKKNKIDEYSETHLCTLLYSRAILVLFLFFINKSKSIKLFLFFFLRLLPQTGNSFCLVASYIMSLSKMASKSFLDTGLNIGATLMNPKSLFKAIFDTLIIQLSTKRKMFPVGYDSGSILEKT